MKPSDPHDANSRALGCHRPAATSALTIDRREALRTIGVVGVGLALGACSSQSPMGPGVDPDPEPEPDPGPGPGPDPDPTPLTVTDDFTSGDLAGWAVQVGSASVVAEDIGTSTFTVIHRTAEEFGADQYSEVVLAPGFSLDGAGPRWNGAAISVRYRPSDNARYNPIGGRPADGPLDGGVGWKGRWTLKLDGTPPINTEYFAVKDRQHLRPTSEDFNSGGWTPGGGGASSTFEAIDDPAQDLSDVSDFNSNNVVSENVEPDDAQYIETPLDPSGALIRFGCTLFAGRTLSEAGAAPKTDKQHRVRLRHRRVGGDRTVTLDWRLKQGAVVIEEGQISGIGDAVSESVIWLDPSNVANISDYDELFLECEASVEGGTTPSRVRVTYLELDVPDVMPVPGDRIRVEVRGTGPSTVVTVIKNGVALLSGTPTGTTGAGFVDEGRAPGFPMSPVETVFSTYASSWVGGDL